MSRILIISPHYDDAIGSCGGRILNDDSNNNYTVLTVFAKPHDEHLSPFALHLHRDVWNVENAWEIRSRENVNACSYVKAETLEMPFLEAIYRTDAEGNWLYPNDGDIFKEVVAEDLQLESDIKKCISRLIDSFDEVIFPAGRGMHVDHLILTKIGLELSDKCPHTAFYNDFSYEKAACILPADWKVNKCRISYLNQCKKETAISKYESQIEMLFGEKKDIRNHYLRYYKDEDGFYEVYYEK